MAKYLLHNLGVDAAAQQVRGSGVPQVMGSYLRHKLAPTSEHCLEGFIRLHDATQDEVAAFAHKYGDLGLCGHEKPGGSQGLALPWHEAETCPRCAAGEPGSPFEAWIWCARQLRAALLVGALLRSGKPAAVDLYQGVYRDLGFALMGYAWLDRVGPASFPWRQWGALQVLVNLWMNQAHGPRLVANPDGLGQPGIRIELWAGPALRGILAAQLAGSLSSKTGVYECDNCGEPFMPKRAPWRNGKRAAYCFECKTGPAKAERERLRSWESHPTVVRDSKYRQKTHTG